MYMPDAAREIVYTGAAKPPSWGERLVRAHTPEAHYQDIMKKYFWVTDRLEGKSLELVQSARPAVELSAKAAGWSQTIIELYLAGSAVAITAILAGKGLRSAAGVFSEMARRHGSTAPFAPIEAPKQNRRKRIIRGNWKEVKTPDVIYLGPAADVADPSPVMPDTHPPTRSETAAPSRLSPARFAGFAAVTSRVATETHPSQPKNPAIVAPGRDGRESPDGDTRSTPPPKIRMNRWEQAYDDGIGTDPSAVTQKAGTMKLLQTMMMDRSDGGFFNVLARAMVEPNAQIRQKMVEKAVLEAAKAFGVNQETTLAAQLLIEYMTSQTITTVS